jgi:hypothetical protein
LRIGLLQGEDGRPFYDVTKIESVSSVDFVSNPAAGGRVLRLVASDTVAHSLEKDGNMLKKMIEAIKGSGNAALIAKLEGFGTTPTEDQVIGPVSGTSCSHPGPEAAPGRRRWSPAAGGSRQCPGGDSGPRPRKRPAHGRSPAAGSDGGRACPVPGNSLDGCALPVVVKESIRAGSPRPKIEGAKKPGDLPAKAEITGHP